MIELVQAFPGDNIMKIQTAAKTIKKELNLEKYTNQNTKNTFIKVNGILTE
jgi:hypothetical protein